MKRKIFMKLSTIAMVFLVGVGFIGNTASLSASVIDTNLAYNDNLYVELLSKGEVIENTNNERAIISAAIAASIVSFFGKVALAAIVYSVVRLGAYTACMYYNNTNAAWDFYCDATNNFRD